MRVQVRFLDGEVMDGESEAANATRMGFPVTFTGGNNQVAWISLASIKYVRFLAGMISSGTQDDPRHSQNLIKVVLHFNDGETMRTYKDDTFSQEGEGYYVRIWNDETKSLERVLVSLHSLKAIFFVNQWDSRSDEEKARFSGSGPAGGGRGDLHEGVLRQIDELSPPPE
jgi:hypothetical protein